MTYIEAAAIAERQTQATGQRWWAECELLTCDYYATDGDTRIETTEGEDKKDAEEPNTPG